jgi:hypothetical protein
MMAGSWWGPKCGFGFGMTVAAADAAVAETPAATRSRSPGGAAIVFTLDSAATASGASQRERMAPPSEGGGLVPATAWSSSSEIVCSNRVCPKSLMTRPGP